MANVVGQSSLRIQNVDIIEAQEIEMIRQLFPRSPEEIKLWLERTKQETIEQLQRIIAIPAHERTFENSIKALDNITLSEINVIGNAIQVLEMVSPDEALRHEAYRTIIELHDFWVEQVSSNELLYRAVKEYAQGNALHEQLTIEQWYFIEELLRDWQRAGLDLPIEQQNKIKALKKELGSLSAEFDKNIASDLTTIAVYQEELAGLSERFIHALARDEHNRCLLPMNYPTYYPIMQECIVEQTRKKAYKAFIKRAYPHNSRILEQIIAKRAQLARELGFKSYAELDLADQMAMCPDRVQEFMDTLLEKVAKKAYAELKLILQDMPDSVIATADGRLQPWDMPFATAQYKKKHFNIDEQHIAEYFPMEHTIDRLLTIYKEFFSIDFKQIPCSGLWHDDVKCIKVINNEGTILGYLLLDLHPRPFKYSHACHATIVPATYVNGVPNIAISVLIANFTRSTATQPSLLKKDEVNTFFHEFGHALHALLGRTKLAGHAGTKVKTDFVELPSQILEEWLYDKDILKMVSSHYTTKEQLSDECIENIIKVRNIFAGNATLGQLLYSSVSLTYFNSDTVPDLQECVRRLHRTIIVDTAFDADNHFYANFGHLTGYGSKYYSYLWSKVFAKDLFYYIKQRGLLNPEVGKQYIAAVLSKGGSKDPNELLRDFLGRQPNQEAFLSDLGLQ